MGGPPLSRGKEKPEVFAGRAGSWDECCSAAPKSMEILTSLCREDGRG